MMRPPAKLGWRTLLGIALLSVQVGGIVYARFVPSRYLCWAPYDEITLFRIHVVIGGRELSQPEVAARYRFHRYGRDNRSWAHVTDAIVHYESTRGAGDDARVSMTFRVNGGPERVWTWPSEAAP